MSQVEIGSVGSILSKYLAAHNYSQIAVIVDDKTKRFCYPKIKSLLPKHLLVSIKNGEINKNLETCGHIWQVLTDANADRHSLVINLGGGVIGDMGGFCASTYKRGIDFIQMPTTLLSQVDASVGGKLGIDFNGFKNHIGVFRVPNLVIIDPDFLKTLPMSELRSGFAEVIKHCLIKDADMWGQISRKDLAEQNWAALIAHSVAIKSAITEADPTEKGLRKILNFGHTLGHAVETYLLNSPRHLLHGEAIAVGMITEAYISMKRGHISKAELAEIEEYIFAIYGKVDIKEADFEAVIKLTLQDKKNRAGKVLFSLLKGIGNCMYDVEVSNKEMRAALGYYIAP
jgi:3-dehydroquinate synthase